MSGCPHSSPNILTKSTTEALAMNRSMQSQNPPTPAHIQQDHTSYNMFSPPTTPTSSPFAANSDQVFSGTLNDHGQEEGSGESMEEDEDEDEDDTDEEAARAPSGRGTIGQAGLIAESTFSRAKENVSRSSINKVSHLDDGQGNRADDDDDIYDQVDIVPDDDEDHRLVYDDDLLGIARHFERGPSDLILIDDHDQWQDYRGGELENLFSPVDAFIAPSGQDPTPPPPTPVTPTQGQYVDLPVLPSVEQYSSTAGLPNSSPGYNSSDDWCNTGGSGYDPDGELTDSEPPPPKHCVPDFDCTQYERSDKDLIPKKIQRPNLAGKHGTRKGPWKGTFTVDRTKAVAMCFKDSFEMDIRPPSHPKGSKARHYLTAAPFNITACITDGRFQKGVADSKLGLSTSDITLKVPDSAPETHTVATMDDGVHIDARATPVSPRVHRLLDYDDFHQGCQTPTANDMVHNPSPSTVGYEGYNSFQPEVFVDANNSFLRTLRIDHANSDQESEDIDFDFNVGMFVDLDYASEVSDADAKSRKKSSSSHGLRKRKMSDAHSGARSKARRQSAPNVPQDFSP